MSLSLSDFIAKGQASGTKTFALSKIKDDEKYTLSVDLGATNNPLSRSVPVTTGTNMGALVFPQYPSGNCVFYDQTNAADWTLSANDIQAGNLSSFVSTNGIDESATDLCMLIGHASTGNGSNDYVHFYYNELAIDTGTSSVGSEQTDLLTKAQGAVLYTASIQGKTFAELTATQYKLYWYDATADDLRVITVTRSTKNATLGTAGRNGSGQSGYLPNAVNYISADGNIAAYIQIVNAKDLHIELNYTDSTTGFWHYNFFWIPNERLGVNFPQTLNANGLVLQFMVCGSYLYIYRMVDSTNQDLIGNRAFLRADFDAWLLSLIKTVV